MKWVTRDSVRLMDWAQNLHRRGDYAGSMTLAQKVAEKNPNSSQMTSALWIIGRSSHFLGDYNKALETFSVLISNHSGSDEAAEALFRSSLIYYRKKITPPLWLFWKNYCCWQKIVMI